MRKRQNRDQFPQLGNGQDFGATARRVFVGWQIWIAAEDKTMTKGA